MEQEEYITELYNRRHGLEQQLEKSILEEIRSFLRKCKNRKIDISELFNPETVKDHFEDLRVCLGIYDEEKNIKSPSYVIGVELETYNDGTEIPIVISKDENGFLRDGRKDVLTLKVDKMYAVYGLLCDLEDNEIILREGENCTVAVPANFVINSID